MITIYIKELEKEDRLNKKPKLIESTIYKFIKTFNIIKVDQIEENRKIYLVPNINKISVYKRLNKKLKKEETKTQKVQIVLEEKVKKYKDRFLNFKIVDGKSVFKDLIEHIIKKVIAEDKLELQDIYITTNYYIDNNVNLIKNLALKVKSINVITKEVEKYKVLEEIMQEKGIAISVANNKKKSLKKAKIIVNLDFKEEKLNEYILNRNAIIINVNQAKLLKLKGFEGIIIRNIDIKLDKEKSAFKNKNKLINFTNIDIYESLKNKQDKTEKIHITKLYGNNGEISKEEIKNWQKNIENINKNIDK